MKNDPIVEEARKAGQAYLDSFKGDWKAVIDDLNRRSRDECRNIIQMPPRTPKTRSVKLT